MSGETLSGLSSKEEIRAALRSHAWRLFGEALAYPDDELCAAIRSGELSEAFRGVLAELHPEVTGRGDLAGLSEAGEGDDLAVEYTRLFDVGPSGPPCTLYGGHYGGARMKTMEEAVRFYNHFGLTLAESPRELPDHLGTELEFLHYLTFREAEALRDGADPGPYRRAQRDFVARHPGRWVPELLRRLEAQSPMAYFRALIGLLADFLAAERDRLVREEGPVPRGVKS